MAQAAIALNQPKGRRQPRAAELGMDGIFAGGARTPRHDRDLCLPARLFVRDEFFSVGPERALGAVHRAQQLQGNARKPALPAVAAQSARLHRRDHRGRDYGGHGRRGAHQRQVARPASRADAAPHSADDRARRRRPQLPLALQFPIRIHRRAARRSASARDSLALGSALGACLDHHRGRLAEYAADGAAFPRGPAIAAA